MSTRTRMAAFAAAAGVVFGVAALAGAGLGPLRGEDDGHGRGGGHSASAEAPPGLAVAEDGLRLVASTTTLERGAPARWSFRIADADDATLSDFDVEHEREMHLILVRRDLTGYQHLHPRRDAAGRWSVPLRLPEAGVYRAYADFHTGGRAYTLATDLVVTGPFAPRLLPAAAPVAAEGPYRAELRTEGVAAGGDAALTYRLSRDGRRLDGVEPYLGADGHLVALREGDGAFLHVHPEESDETGTIRFAAELPSPGRYRLFLQFKHEGVVRTVVHTLEVTR